MTDADAKTAQQIGEDLGRCYGALERADEIAKADQSLPDSLDREMISAGIASAKSKIVECGTRTKATGKVKLKVNVAPDGKVSALSIESAPDASLGDCVASAVRATAFKPTKVGGSFSYPFLF